MQNISIYSNGAIHIIKPEDLLYVQAVGSYTDFVLVSGKCMRAAKNMKTIMSSFPEIDWLLKVHRSYYINIRYVSQLYYTSSNKLIALLNESKEVPVSQISITALRKSCMLAG